MSPFWNQIFIKESWILFIVKFFFCEKTLFSLSSEAKYTPNSFLLKEKHTQKIQNFKKQKLVLLMNFT